MRKIALAALVFVAACGSKEPEAAAGAGMPADVTPAAVTAPAAASAPEAAAESSDGGAVTTEVAQAPASMSPTAPPATWTIDKSASRIEFTGSQTGKDFTGSFSSFDVAIAFDSGNLGASRIKATIETASASTGDRQRDDALPSSDWFSSASFPTAVFESSDIRAAGSGFEARGRLTIRGVAKDVALPFSLKIEGDRATADGSVSLIRTDFGVGQGEFAGGEWVGLDVKVTLHIEATR